MLRYSTVVFRKILNIQVFYLTFICSSFSVFGQIGNFVPSSGEVVNLGSIDLRTSTQWVTQRSLNPGFFSSKGIGLYIESSDAHHVNGYVKNYWTTANRVYRFPVGSGTDLRYVEVSGSVPANAILATAWILGDPSSTQDPTDQAFHPVTSVAVGIQAVSTVGQWDWLDANNLGSGVTVAVSIPDMTSFGLASELRLVGWNGSQWISLGSTGATTTTEDGVLSGTMLNGITALGIGKITSGDTDGDGVPDAQELVDGTDPNDKTSYLDTDGDRVPDYVETNFDSTNPADKSDYKDTDGDLVPNYIETVFDATNPNDALSYLDADGDKVPDYVETTIDNTDPNASTSFKDSDTGGVPDYVESILFLKSGLAATNPSQASDDSQDSDGDGVPDYQELVDGTNPLNPTSYLDSDGDRVPDYIEVNGDATDPNLKTSYKDTDGDLVPDYVESKLEATDPTNNLSFRDLDGDKVPDYVESVLQNTNPIQGANFLDTDGGGVPDYVETILYVNLGLSATDPNLALDDANDLDGDGLSNYAELKQNSDLNDPCDPSRPAGYTGYVATNPIWAAADCDGDGFSNGAEVLAGTDPYNANSAIKPDLFPNFTFGNSIFNMGGERYVIININEINGASTNGTGIQFFIPKISGFQLNFDNTLSSVMVLTTEIVNNANWTVTDNGVGLLFSSNTTISANGSSRVALKLTGQAAGTAANLTVNIIQGSGGENFPYNNVGVLSQSIQN
ncbi:MAG: hypothetical protein ACK4LB_11300 [Spirosomataceae bacterium]